MPGMASQSVTNDVTKLTFHSVLNIRAANTKDDLTSYES